MSKIGIALATYKPNIEFFKQQIASVKAQTDQDWICWLVDDASGDLHETMIRQVIGNDTRFELIFCNENVGSFANFERAIAAVSKECSFIALCDQDDIWHSHKLERMRVAFDDPLVMLVHSDLRVIDADNHVISPSCWNLEGRRFWRNSPNEIILKNFAWGCASMFRRELLDHILPFFPPNAPLYYHHDHWLLLCASMKGRVESIAEPLLDYRQHGANVVGAKLALESSIGRKLSGLRALPARGRFALRASRSLARHAAMRLGAIEAEVWFRFWPLIWFVGVNVYRDPRLWRQGLQLIVGIVCEDGLRRAR